MADSTRGYSDSLLRQGKTHPKEGQDQSLGLCLLPHMHPFIQSPIQCPNHPPQLTHPLSHPFTHSFVHPPINLSIHLTTQQFIYPLIHPLLHSLTHKFLYPFIHLSNQLLTRLSMHPIISPSVHPSTHSPINKELFPLCVDSGFVTMQALPHACSGKDSTCNYMNNYKDEKCQEGKWSEALGEETRRTGPGFGMVRKGLLKCCSEAQL